MTAVPGGPAAVSSSGSSMPFAVSRYASSLSVEVFPIHTAAVIGHGDFPESAVFQVNFNRVGAGVDGVIQKFPQNRSGAVDDFAGGNGSGNLRR